MLSRLQRRPCMADDGKEEETLDAVKAEEKTLDDDE